MTQHSHTSQRFVLPSGLADRLPPLAAANLHSTQALMSCFMGFGYEPVTPSIIEYAESMLADVPEDMREAYFQFQDPVSNQLLALRANMTSQLVRIAKTSLGSAPRPLRLCYAGQRVRAVPETLHTRREHRQVGIEYIGATSMHAEAEVIVLAEHALSKVGLNNLILDIHLPVLLHSVITQLPKAAQNTVRAAITRKDKEGLRKCGADFLADLLDVRGTPKEVSQFLKQHKQPVMYASSQLDDLTALLEEKECGMRLQVDALDGAYQSHYEGISFSIFSADPEFEVARGGRYRLTEHEQAVGFTLYLDDVLAYLPPQPARARIATASNISTKQADALQSEGYVTIYSEETQGAALKAQGFTHQFINQTIVTL